MAAVRPRPCARAHRLVLVLRTSSLLPRMTRYPILMLSSPTSILSSFGHLPYRYCHLPCHLPIDTVILRSFPYRYCHLVDRMTILYLVTLLLPPCRPACPPSRLALHIHPLRALDSPVAHRAPRHPGGAQLAQRHVAARPQQHLQRLVPTHLALRRSVREQGLTLVHLSAQRKRFVWGRGCA